MALVKMKGIIIKYGLILSVGFLINNYMQIIPAIDNLVDNVLSGWIATIYMISILLFGINQYVKFSFKDDTYEFGNAFLVGTGIAFLGATIFSLVSTTILLLNGIEFNLTETIITRILKYGIIGLIVSLIIPLTYKKKKNV